MRGKDAVRDYWIRQWAEIHPTVLPTAFSVLDEHRVAVEVRQIVRTLQGAPLQDRRVTHLYAFNADGMITRMDVETPGRTRWTPWGSASPAGPVYPSRVTG